MLCDTGPLVALIDTDYIHHERADQTVAELAAERFVTTWACLTEALYLLGKVEGHRGQDRLLEFVERGILMIYAIEPVSIPRVRALMKKYSDAPMDFADASLVVAAELTGEKQVFTFDRTSVST
jgi:predicted nucleic acid-binding protein